MLDRRLGEGHAQSERDAMMHANAVRVVLQLAFDLVWRRTPSATRPRPTSRPVDGSGMTAIQDSAIPSGLVPVPMIVADGEFKAPLPLQVRSAIAM
jgi:hypothetical protein